MSDPIADMLTRIRNAVAVGHESTSMPYSKLKEAILAILKDNGYIGSFAVEGEGVAKRIAVELKLDGTITKMIRVSKPGRRVYAGVDQIPLVLGGRGIVIMSTPGGVMTGREARKRRLGGELICKVW